MKKTSKACLALSGVLLVLAIPFFLTLSTIKDTRPLVPFENNPSPYGYTWSLSIFLLPASLLLGWFFKQKDYRAQQKAFWTTVVLMASLGMLLDIFFGLTFFTFHNTSATLGIHFWGYNIASGAWQRTIPIEEVGFYAFGCLAILLTYIWANEYWLPAYKVTEPPAHSRKFLNLVSFHPASALIGLAFFALGWAFKKFCPLADPNGFPGYFLFIVAVAITPSILFFDVAARFVNWRAYSIVFFATLLVSLFWEAAVALPYQWWGYNPNQMLGFSLRGLSGLPIEEPILWLAASWAITITYETFHTFMRMGIKEAEEVLFRSETVLESSETVVIRST